MKARFSPSHQSTFFPHQDTKNVPIDGLPMYIEQTWDVIKNDKELNLPDQREMVANYRCSEIKDEALGKVQALLSSLRTASMQTLMDDFPARCTEITT